MLHFGDMVEPIVNIYCDFQKNPHNVATFIMWRIIRTISMEYFDLYYIGLQYWRIGLIHDNLQHGLFFQLKIYIYIYFLGVMLHLFLLNYDLTLFVLRQCLYKKHNKQLDLL